MVAQRTGAMRTKASPADCGAHTSGAALLTPRAFARVRSLSRATPCLGGSARGTERTELP